MKKKYIIFPIILLVGIFIGMFIYKNYNVDTSQGK